jgi:hypothetical protein
MTHEFPPIPPRTFLDGLRAWWPIITAVALAAWVIFKWIDTQRSLAHNRRLEVEKQAQIRGFELQKPFLDEQLKLYFETAKVVGNLATLDQNDPKWREALQRFDELYWSELSMVEQSTVESAMVRLRQAIDMYRGSGQSKGEVQFRSYCLAHAIRDGVRQTWIVNIEGTGFPKEIATASLAAYPGGKPSSPERKCTDEVNPKSAIP